jgi:hypothetical protein
MPLPSMSVARVGTTDDEIVGGPVHQAQKTPPAHAWHRGAIETRLSSTDHE